MSEEFGDEIIKELEAGCREGFFLVERSGTGKVLGIDTAITEYGSSASVLLVFKSDADAEEYLQRYGLEGEWDIVEMESPEEVYEALEGADESFSHVAVNPPLKTDKPFMMMNIMAFREVLAEYFGVDREPEDE